ncbi:MAG: hypothetical protein AAGJ79_03120 [Verrucomicrobiota bacterium]
MKTEIDHDKLLLYWSDELNREEASRLEAAIANDPCARTYLEELEELRTDFETFPETKADSSATEIALADFHESPRPRRLVLPWLAAVAAVIVAAFFLLRGADSPDHGTIADTLAKPAESQMDKEPGMPKRTLSDSLFASQTRFSTANRFHSSSRDRLRRIREARESKSS